MFNNNERDNMDNLKVEVIKKLLMLDTNKDLIKASECISDGISNELADDEKNQEAFEQWKAEKEIDETK